MTVQLGDITIDQVLESEGPLFDAHTFLPSLTPELLAENIDWLAEMGAIDKPSRKLVLAVQSYVVRTPHHTILIDTCVGNDKPRPTHPFWNELRSETYMRGLAAVGLRVEDVDYVMCTHLHVDHTGWNTRLENGRWVPTFPNARYVFSEQELAHWTAQNEVSPLPWIVDSVLPIVAAGQSELVADDHALGEHIRLEPTPGHTPHHFAVQLGRGRTHAVVAGDLIHSPLQARYPDISMRADFDAGQAAQTRRNFLSCYCESGTLVCTAHFPSPSRGTVSRWGDGFRFTASTD